MAPLGPKTVCQSVWLYLNTCFRYEIVQTVILARHRLVEIL
jgi:hypothetical protein